MLLNRSILYLLLLLLSSSLLIAADDPKSTTMQMPESNVRVRIMRSGPTASELIEVKEQGTWKPTLSAAASATLVMAGEPRKLQSCAIKSVEQIKRPAQLNVVADCGAGQLKRTLRLTGEADVIAVEVSFRPNEGIPIHSVEDRYAFVPARRQTNTLTQGPMDFVWSQNLKNEPDGLMPQWTFKSPTVMLQQGRVFAALMPDLARSSQPPLALDLDVTSQEKPWFSYGRIPSEPYGHSYFRRSSTALVPAESRTIAYSYSIVASVQPERLGYRRVVRRLWQTLGHPALLQSADSQRNVRRPELSLFDEWRKDAWVRYADAVYRDVDCPGGNCGSLISNRNYMGEWDKPVEDAWFNSWFESLRTAYGWYLYAHKTDNKEIQRKAEGVLNLALHSPQQDGAFSTIYLVPDHRWIREDGWAGFSDDYHAFCMSWTAYWMLKWVEDLTPQRKDEVLAFTRRYGDFLLKHQLPSGVIPSWYDSDLTPRKEFRDMNAETAGSAFFLLELSQVSGDRTYLQAAMKAMEFISREVLPRQVWWDFETFRSCARKDFGFYDSTTAQYPQNNLSTIQAAKAYLKLYQLSKNRKWLNLGTEVLDYLLLTQQVWNPPYFSPKLLGGFTTQNTDAEWSDARQCYAAVLLLDYYRATGELEYLERAVAAARATFAVAPWENWAHTGYKNEPGAMTGFHWGTGSAMTSVEIMAATLGDAFIDISRKQGTGFNANSLTNVKVAGNLISFDVQSVPELTKMLIRFSGVNPSVVYKISANNRRPVGIDGTKLARDGFEYVLDGSARAQMAKDHEGGAAGHRLK